MHFSEKHIYPVLLCRIIMSVPMCVFFCTRFKIPYENFQRRYNLSTIILIIVLKGFAKYLIEIVFPIGEKYFLQETSRKFDSDK